MGGRGQVGDACESISVDGIIVPVNWLELRANQSDPDVQRRGGGRWGGRRGF